MHSLWRVFHKLEGTSHFLDTYCGFGVANLAVCFLVLLVLLWLGGEAVWSPPALRRWRWLALRLALAYGVLLLASSVVCSIYLGLQDHAETTVISNSWLFGHGRPAYPRGRCGTLCSRPTDR